MSQIRKYAKWRMKRRRTCIKEDREAMEEARNLWLKFDNILFSDQMLTNWLYWQKRFFESSVINRWKDGWLIVIVIGVDPGNLKSAFVVLKKIVKKMVLDPLDHKVINDVIEIASCENISKWIWGQLVDLKSLIQAELDDPNLPQSITKYFKDNSKEGVDVSEFSDQVRLHEVSLWETPTSFAVYRGE